MYFKSSFESANPPPSNLCLEPLIENNGHREMALEEL